MTQPGRGRLRRELRLFDVYVISTGAMFSSGFFLLPGLAAAGTGPSVVIAYLMSGLLIVPALVSQAELATAMPRAGGAYYFLDRTLGPLMGTIGGIGTWAALVLKSAFALIGMGAYLALVIHVPIKLLAIVLAAVFVILNVLGARQSTRLIRVLVFGLLSILGLFIVHGFWTLSRRGLAAVHESNFTPLFTEGIDGLFGAVGLVFVSYVGLTNVASLAEEVDDPDRNIPLGMTLALGTVIAVYVLGVYIMVGVMGTDALSSSLTPVADAAVAFFTWIPTGVAAGLVVAGAVAAFASMANTGMLAASRYPLAMARDHLLPPGLATLGRFRTPTTATVITAAIMVATIVILDVAEVAKLASALQLILFGLINIAVIVMRESHIESYDPGFRSPLYPWMQIAGIAFPLILVAEMGWLASLFSMGLIAASMAWYNHYARGRLARDGAIYHVFERLGRRRFAGLDQELRDIMKEKGARAEDPFDEVVARAFVLDLGDDVSIGTVLERSANLLSRRLPASADTIADRLQRGIRAGGTPVAHGAALIHARIPHADVSELVLVRCTYAVTLPDVGDDTTIGEGGDTPIEAMFVLVSGQADPGRHLRILAHLAGRIEHGDFLDEWREAQHEQDLKETLLRDDRFLSLEIRTGRRSEILIGRALKDLQMPEGSLVALIRRRGQTLVPRGRTVLRDMDRLTIIGEPAGLERLTKEYGEPLPR